MPVRDSDHPRLHVWRVERVVSLVRLPNTHTIPVVRRGLRRLVYQSSGNDTEPDNVLPAKRRLRVRRVERVVSLMRRTNTHAHPVVQRFLRRHVQQPSGNDTEPDYVLPAKRRLRVRRVERVVSLLRRTNTHAHPVVQRFLRRHVQQPSGSVSEPDYVLPSKRSLRVRAVERVEQFVRASNTNPNRVLQRFLRRLVHQPPGHH
jgi:hypothetical protein